MIKLEVCAESITSAITAERCGASRIEFCDNMHEGGTTPSYGNILIIKEKISIPFFPIIRPRGGDFIYTDYEFEVMREDVKFCGEAGCEGVVTGILNADGSVDVERTRELVRIASSYGMEVTFHRAFDVSRDLRESLEAVISAGCTRILTSGGMATAEEGVDELAELTSLAGGRIIIIPGSGVTPDNAAGIIRSTGCTEIHGTFRSRVQSASRGPAWADFTRWQADPDKIKMVISNLEAV